MKDFYVHIPTKIYFGESFLNEYLDTIISCGRKILLVSGGGSVKKNGFYDPILNALKEKGADVCEFSGIEPNPLSKTINACVAEHKNNGIEVVLAFGGGSVMDAAKGIAALLYLDSCQKKGLHKNMPLDIWQYVLGSEHAGSLPGALPIATIPTTAATASEVTPYAVISNTDKQGKSPVAYEFLKPSASYLDPAYTCRLPDTATQDGAADILSHVFENYLLGGSEAVFTDKYCESVISSVVETLPLVLEDPFNIEHRGTLLWCSTMALNGMHLARRDSSPFILHAIEHAMSAVHHELAHGRGLATLYPAYFRWLWNKERARERLGRLGKEIFALNESHGLSGLHFIEQFELWLSRCGLLQSAKDLGFAEAEYQTVAEYTIQVYGDGSSIDALGEVTVEDVVEILKMTETQGSLRVH